MSEIVEHIKMYFIFAKNVKFNMINKKHLFFMDFRITFDEFFRPFNCWEFLQLLYIVKGTFSKENTKHNISRELRLKRGLFNTRENIMQKKIFDNYRLLIFCQIFV